MPTTCELCARVVPDERIDDPQVIQDHHLRPERRADSPTVTLCRPCHEQLHASFTNEQLREEFDTIEALREADPLAAYLSWIRTTEKLDSQVETSDETR